ncbi:hypothetical protein ACHQM5_001454 [Ranunculus cassubicifolius]
MVLHLLVLTKLKLLSLTHISSTALTSALVMLILKLPSSSRHLSRVCSNAFIASRLFLFRFSVIMFEYGNNGGIDAQRWDRAVRLVRERMTNTRNSWSSEIHEGSLHAATIVAL